MRTEREVTHLLEDWLADGARPLPDHILEAVIETIPQVRQVRTRMFELDRRMPRALAAIAVAAAVVVAVIAGPEILSRLRTTDGFRPAATPRPIRLCDTPTFRAPLTIDTLRTGVGPVHVTTGDFNADGAVDFVVANELDGAATLGVVLGRGDGTFGEPARFPSGRAWFVAAADVNEDGRLDLVGAASAEDSVAVLIGDGLGGFAEPRYVPAGAQPRSLVVGQFNDDQPLDLAVAATGSNAIAILYGDGRGGFSEPEMVPTSETPSSVTAADFNGDSHLDLAIGLSEAQDLEVRLADPAGGFGVPRLFPANFPASVTAADVNGDGRIDLVTGNPGKAGVAVMIGDGLGSFGVADFLPLGESHTPGPVIVARLDDDLVPDVAASDFTDDNVVLFRGEGDGRFALTELIKVPNGPLGMASADFDGDGRTDLVTSDANVNSATVLLNGCGG